MTIDKTHTAILIFLALLGGVWIAYKGIVVNTGNYEWVTEDGSSASSNVSENLRWFAENAQQCRERCLENTLSCNAWTFVSVNNNHNCWGYETVALRSNTDKVGYESGEICKLLNMASCFSTHPKINSNK